MVIRKLSWQAGPSDWCLMEDEKGLTNKKTSKTTPEFSPLSSSTIMSNSKQRQDLRRGFWDQGVVTEFQPSEGCWLELTSLDGKLKRLGTFFFYLST